MSSTVDVRGSSSHDCKPHLFSELVPLSPASLYTANCERHGVHANIGVLRALEGVCVTCCTHNAAPTCDPDTNVSGCVRESVCIPASSDEGLFSGKRCLDLTRNFVGRHGLEPLLEVLRQTPVFDSVKLSNNFVDSELVCSVVVTTLRHIPHLKSVDLSGNPISQLGGRALVAFARDNPNIVNIDVTGTRINPALVRRISAAVVENRELNDDERQRRMNRMWACSAKPASRKPVRTEVPQERAEHGGVGVTHSLAREADRLAGSALQVVFASIVASKAMETGAEDAGPTTPLLTDFAALDLLRAVTIENSEESFTPDSSSCES